mmetsp:Transcript_54045/g.175670  ORF Transcript_54045/g.175670 Transcript_54045/m.175670 type:complete len:105 (+) Transcript_54045:56-370(+)
MAPRIVLLAALLAFGFSGLEVLADDRLRGVGASGQDINQQAACTTAGSSGVGAGHDCVFPFRYAGVVYRSCTTVGWVRDWCPVEVDEYGNFVSGKWGDCGAGCL